MKQTKRYSIQDESSSSQDTKSTSSLSSGSALGKRAADALANADLSGLSEPKPDLETLTEIKETTERLATELNDFLTKHEAANSPRLLKAAENSNRRPDFANMSDEAIADIQLATARKLREVCLSFYAQLFLMISIYFSFSQQHHHHFCLSCNDHSILIISNSFYRETETCSLKHRKTNGFRYF
ncbi:MAG: hypothetical protein ACI8RD_003996 [Bacillariaceae sp.]|jgi:hypothetical protein